MPLIFGAPVMRVLTHRSKVAAGRIAVFHSRSSLLLSNPVNSEFVLSSTYGQRTQTLAVTSRSLRSIPGITPVWTFLPAKRRGNDTSSQSHQYFSRILILRQIWDCKLNKIIFVNDCKRQYLRYRGN